MRPWQITLESIVMLFLWTLNVVSDSFACLFLFFLHIHGALFMLTVLGIMHFLLNCWILRFQWQKMNKIVLSTLFLTQTAALFMICRRAWRSLVPYCTKDDRTKKRKLLIAKYSLCIETWYSSKKFPTEGNTIEMRSCLPPEMIANPNHIPTVSDSCNDVENNDSMIDKFFTGEEESQQIIPMGTTKYAEGTYNIELNFSSPQELYVGEPSLLKFLMKTLQHLFVEEKKISYHIVTDSSNKILYITKSNRHIKDLPSRNIPGHSALCNDIHYAVNLAKGSGYEIFAVTKRTFDENKFLVDADISKLLWSLVWPSAIIKLYTILGILVTTRGFTSLMLITPLISVVTWLFTQKGVSEPWRNVFLMIPLRLNLSVSRTLLVTGIGISNLPLAAACYISVKAVGMIALTTYVAYSKKFKNIELYRDEIDRYSYNPILDPVIQFSESFVYMSWAIWLYATAPRTPSPIWIIRYNHLPLILFLSTLLGHVFGLTWLWFTRSKVKKPLRDPKSVLRLVQSLEYIKT